VSVKVTTFTPTLAITEKFVVPDTARSMLKPVSFAELSFQVSFTVFPLTEAVRFVGAATVV